MQFSGYLQLRLKGEVLCRYLCSVMFGRDPTISSPPLGDIKSSSPSESPLMEKRELREAHCPILKQTVTPPAVNQNPSAQPQAAPEERRVAFDIGDSEDVENNKERKVAFDIGDTDETDCSLSNGSKFARHIFLIINVINDVAQ